METIAQQIKKQKVDALMTECKVFFAFNKKQFEASKPELSEGDKFVAIGAGGYIPKSLVDKFVTGMADINKEFSKKMKSDKVEREKYILDTLNNHECFYTYDLQEALDVLGSGYTYKEVKKVFDKYEGRN